MNRDIFIVITVIVVLLVFFIYVSGVNPLASTTGGPYFSPKFTVRENSLSSERQSLIGGSLSEKLRAIITRNRSARQSLEPRTEISAPRSATKNRQEVVSDASQSESPYNGKITLSAARSKEKEAKKEYLTITIRAGTDGVLITGWKLKNSKGEEFKIGKGAHLVFSSEVNPQEDIVLMRREKAIIITGRSPVGTSFKTNECVGYFQQFQEFFPSLRESCPFPGNEDNIQSAGLNDTCLNYIERLPSCRIPLGQKPLNLDNQCLNFIEENINYNGCVKEHKQDADFYKDTWMVYLNRDAEIWKQQREDITLYDQNGKLVDLVSY